MAELRCRPATDRDKERQAMHADRVADTDVKSHPWHTYSDPELFQKVASGEQGLQAAEVAHRLA